MIEIAQRLGMSVVEDSIRVDSLRSRWHFFMSSTRGLMPIVELDPGGRVRNGELTSIFLALRDAYDERLRCDD